MRNLAAHSPKKTFIEVYSEFSQHFTKYVDVLTFISQKVFIQSQEDILRLYDRYIATGSDLAKEAVDRNGCFEFARDSGRWLKSIEASRKPVDLLPLGFLEF